MLFRKEAIDAQRQGLQGAVLLRYSRLSNGLFMILLVVVSCVAFGLVTSSFTKRITALGSIKPDRGLVKVYGLDGGNVQQSFVAEGDQVSKGQILFNIISEGKISSQNKLQIQQFKDQLAHQLIQLERLKNSSATEMQITLNQLDGLNDELIVLEQAMAVQTKQLDLQVHRLEDRKTLYNKGFVSRLNVQQSHEQVLASRIQSNQWKLDKQRLENRILALNLERQLRADAKSSQISSTESQIVRIKQSIEQLELKQRYSIRSPIDGLVTSIQVTQGQSLIQAKPMLIVMPLESHFIAELYLPTRSVGFISVDQEVSLKYDAYPYQQYGLGRGKVIEVSEAILRPEEIDSSYQFIEPMYRIRVGLDTQMLNARGKNLALEAGMSLNAELNLESRTLIQWLLEPLYRLDA